MSDLFGCIDGWNRLLLLNQQDRQGVSQSTFHGQCENTILVVGDDLSRVTRRGPMCVAPLFFCLRNQRKQNIKKRRQAWRKATPSIFRTTKGIENSLCHTIHHGIERCAHRTAARGRFTLRGTGGGPSVCSYQNKF